MKSSKILAKGKFTMRKSFGSEYLYSKGGSILKSLSICILFLSAFSLFPEFIEKAHAVPAAPVVHDVRQPEGTAFKARQWGDEWQSGWETEDGYTIVHDKATGHWSYPDQDDQGNLVPSDRHVGKHTPGIRDKKHLRPHGGNGKKKSLDGTAPGTASEVSGLGGASGAPELPSEVLRTGTVNIATLMVNFSGTTTTYTRQNFTDLLFSTGTWSLKDFYFGASNGQYTITPGPDGVIDWVTVSGTHDYYGQDGTAIDFTGASRAAKDLWVGDLVYDAVAAADATVDFSVYDNDGDCEVDVVMVAHQGNGQETSANTTDIWSKSWDLSSASYYGQNSHPYTAPNYGKYETNDVCTANPAKHVLINKFIIQPETNGANMTAVGVYVHEYGHYLGLPDLYDTDYTSSGAGEWTVMAGGSWNGFDISGDRPAQLDAWSRYFLGWVTPVQLTGSVSGKTFQAVESSNDIYQFLNGHPGATHATGTGEYFLVENRQLTGFDAALPASGLLLWHVDEARTNNTQEWYPGCVPSANTCNTHYKVALIQADGLYQLEHDLNGGDGNDPFKGGGGVRTVGNGTSPTNDLYSGTASGFGMACVSPSADTMTADIYFGGLPNSTLTVIKSGAGSGTVTGSAGGINCGGTCSASFPVCTNVTLTAIPDSGYYFAGWSGGGCSGTGTCTPSLTEGQEIIASFVPAVDSLTESFISTCGTTPPSGWTMLNNMSGHAAWTFNDPGARTNLTGGSGCFAIADSVYVGMNGVDTELRTPVKNFTGATIVSLAFKTYVRRNGTTNPFFADVDVSVNGAAGPWTNVWQRTEQVSSGQATVSLDISAIAANQSQVMVRFHYYSDLFPYYWAVDDVSLYGVDTQAPDTSITAQPANPANSSSGSLSFTSPDASATFECKLDGGSYSACTSPYNFSGLTDGNHTFSVRAKDASGNVDPTPASYSWVISLYTVTATATGSGSGTVSSSLGEISYSYPSVATGTTSPLDYGTPITLTAAASAGSTVSWTTCSGSVSGNGTFTATCSYTSLDGNKTAEATFTISDGIAPVTTATPSSYIFGNWTNSGSVAVGLSAVDTGGSGVAAGYPKYCVDTTDVCNPTTSGTSLNVTCSADSVCTQYVRYFSVDNANNTETVKSSQVKQDLQSPDTSITVHPTDPSTSTSAGFTFSGDDGTGSGVASFECQFDGGGFSTCTSPQAYSSLGQGSHTFEVRATDVAGNTDASPATYTWTVDSIAPNSPAVTGTSPTYDTRPTWNWTSGGNGGNGTFRYQLDSEVGAWTETGSFSHTPALPLSAGSHTLYVQERDAAGNWSVSGSKLIQINAGTSATWSLVGGTMETCVSSAGQLQSSLSDAETDGYPNLIKVVQGNYIGLFTYAGNENHDLTLQGGYNTGCTARTINPALTILDGDTDASPDGIGNGVTLDMAMINANSTGAITVEGFTVINGNNVYDDGGCIRIYTDAGQTTITGNIVHNCRAINGGGIGVETVSGKSLITNNIAHHNSATLSGGGIYSLTSTGNIVILNNTVADNEATDATSGTGAGVAIAINGDTGSADIINNIIRGNIVTPVTCTDVSIQSDGDGNLTHAVVTFQHNDANLTNGVCSTNGSFTLGAGNINADPQYVNAAGGDYHIQSSSPCKDAGIADPDLQAADIDEQARTVGTAVDMGADEVAPILPVTAPAYMYVPGTVKPGRVIGIGWGISSTIHVTYVVEESTDAGFSTVIQVYSGPDRAVTLSSRPLGTYYYRVKAMKAGMTDSGWVNGPNPCVVSDTVSAPAYMYVPAPTAGGLINLGWGMSSTSGATYVVEESTVADFATLTPGNPVYSGPDRSVSLSGRVNGTYYYRVKAIKAGYTDSTWVNGPNPCVVASSVIPPAYMYVPAAPNPSGIIGLGWGLSSTAGVTYVVEESTVANFATLTPGNPVYSGPNRSVSLSGRTNGTYYYRVKAIKAGYIDSTWVNGPNPCVVASSVIPPAYMYVPAAPNPSQIIGLGWGMSSTAGVTYVVEESTVVNFATLTPESPVYSGPNRSVNLSGRSAGTYYYRVKAIKSGYIDSTWVITGNGCVVP